MTASYSFLALAAATVAFSSSVTDAFLVPRTLSTATTGTLSRNKATEDFLSKVLSAISVEHGHSDETRNKNKQLLEALSFVPEIDEDKDEVEAEPYKQAEPYKHEVEPIKQVFPGISLPGGIPEPIRISNTYTASRVAQFGKESKLFLTPLIIGQPKVKGSLDFVQKLSIRLNNLGVYIPPELKGPSQAPTYNYFGTGKDYAKSLRLLLKTNPFMAPCLTEVTNGTSTFFELKSFDPETYPQPVPTLYGQLLSTLNGVGHRVNFQFDSKMEKVIGYQFFDDITGKEISHDDMDLETAATSAIYNIFFFASCIHATLHVFHYLYTAGLQVASEDFEELNQWANDYAKNIPEKYSQVGRLLLTDPENQLSIITGGSGLGSSQAVRYVLKEVLKNWGMFPSAKGFFMDYMMAGVRSKEKIGGDDGVLLNEFMKHYDLVGEFSEEASNALNSIDSDKLEVAEKKLSTYLKHCGEFTSTLTSVREWLEVMAVTGALHGGTLSYTRTMAMPEVVRWRNYASPTWDFADAFLLFSAAGTIVGVDEHRHVMTDSEGPYDEHLEKVLEKFDEKTTALKKEYQKRLLYGDLKDEFNDFGWILSDYCTDGFDGKQLTITAYV